MTRPSTAEVVVVRQGLGVPGAVGDLQDVLQPVGAVLVGGEHPEAVACSRAITSRRNVAEHAGGLDGAGAGLVDVDGVVAEVGHPQVAQQQAAVGVRVGAHPALARPGAGRRSPGPGRRRRRRAPRAGSCASTSSSTSRWRVVAAGVGERHLVGAPGALDRAGRRPPSGRSSPWGSAARSSARRGAHRLPPRGRGPRCWMSRISSRQRSRVAANAWCIAAGSDARHDVRRVAVAAQQRRAARPRGSGRAPSGWRSCSR